jgi:hypothetical protein
MDTGVLELMLYGIVCYATSSAMNEANEKSNSIIPLTQLLLVHNIQLNP